MRSSRNRRTLFLASLCCSLLVSCGGSSDRSPGGCDGNEDCAELQCPRGGFAHQTCVDFQCVTPPVTHCPNIECTENADCTAERVLPDGGVEKATCVDYACVAPGDGK